MRLISIILAIITVFIFSRCSCRKESGSDTITINGIAFRANVNGDKYIPDKYDVSYPPLRINFWWSPVAGKMDLQIIAEKESNFIEVWIPSPVTPGIKMLRFNTVPYPIIVRPENYGLYHINSPNTSYMTNVNAGGQINILKVDTILQKIEATFEFIGTDKNSGKTVSVTNGFVNNY